MEIIIEKHYESTIEVLSDENGNTVIKKTYNSEVPVIRFLNDYLKNFYGGDAENFDEIMPVAVHEYFLLKKLEPYNIAPRALGLEKNCVYMTFEGNSILHSDERITREEFLIQARNILHVLRSLGNKTVVN